MYKPLNPGTEQKHTYYIGEWVLLPMLQQKHKESAGQDPLVVVCNDCKQEFPLTHETYLDLDDRMKGEYNRRLFEQE